MTKKVEVDMELKKAFSELHEKMVDTTQKLRIADIQIDSLKKTKQHAEITEREVTSLDPSTPTYESVGRCFLLTPFEQVKSNLKNKQTAAQTKITSLEANKTYLEKNLKDFEDNIREMVAHKMQAKKI